METTREVIKKIQPGQSIAIFIGPEGGFSPEEIEGICPTNKEEGFSQELTAKAHRISLGRRILRTETAGLATLAMLIFCLDE
jgi:16S rRNA (uracil1498-N3)-methyltransferase